MGSPTWRVHFLKHARQPGSPAQRQLTVQRLASQHAAAVAVIGTIGDAFRTNHPAAHAKGAHSVGDELARVAMKLFHRMAFM